MTGELLPRGYTLCSYLENIILFVDVFPHWPKVTFDPDMTLR